MRRAAAVAALALAACSVQEKQQGTPDAAPDAPPLAADAPPDTAAPDTSITKMPAMWSNVADATFEFTSDEADATFACSIDGDSPVPCTSPYTRALADGAHTFSVRAIDRAGNSDDTPAEATWNIDTIAPDTTITMAPPAADNSASVKFMFTSNEMNVTFDCAIDGGAYAACTSGKQFGPFTDGAHAFAVRAHDRAGNVDASPAIHTWSIDTSTPDTQITAGPTGPTASNSASFSFLSPDAGPGATFTCKLDAGAFAACSSPHGLVNLSEGSHTFQVRVTDSTGNVDPTPATATWTVDLTPPTTTITSGPTGTVASASASFAFTASEPATFQCQLDGGALAACTSPYSVSMLGQGAHTFSVVATDAAGHVDPTPATRTFTVDTVAPDVTFTTGPAATSGPRVDLAWTVSEAGTTTCTLDGAAYTPCTSPVAMNVPAGAHAFAVKAVDGAGNATTTTKSWTTACAAPDPTGAVGLLHLDDTGQTLANAVAGGAGATLGDTAMAEPTDPMSTAGRYGNALAFQVAKSQHVAWPLGGSASAASLTFEYKAGGSSKAGTLFATGDGGLVVAVDAAGAISAAADGATAKSAATTDNAWHHVAVAVDSASIRLYVDGVKTTVAVGTAAPIAFTSVTLAGDGTLDEVWVASTAFASDDAALATYCPAN